MQIIGFGVPLYQGTTAILMLTFISTMGSVVVEEWNDLIAWNKKKNL